MNGAGKCIFQCSCKYTLRDRGCYHTAIFRFHWASIRNLAFEILEWFLTKICHWNTTVNNKWKPAFTSHEILLNWDQWYPKVKGRWLSMPSCLHVLIFTCFNKNAVNRLPSSQNAAARLLTHSRKSDHITPVSYSLHWLPVKLRIHFKIFVLTFRALHGQSPHTSPQTLFFLHVF